MSSDVGSSEQARTTMSMEMMARAFTLERANPIDIFAMAESLGEGQLNAADSEVVEYVKVSEFCREVRELITAASASIPAQEAQLNQLEVCLLCCHLLQL